LGHAGRWLTDAQGRVVVIHGMNYGLKSPVTLADGTQTLDPAAAGFGAYDLQWLADNGFNGLRLYIQPYGLEPQPGVYDDQYVEQIADLATQAASFGVRPLIDFHQDDYGPSFNGDGFADWASQDDGLPHEPSLGFPYDQFTMTALLVAWDNFWHNNAASDGTGLQDHFAATAAHVASRLASLDGLLGYEYLNEPWPGSAWPSCVAPLVGCPLFDENQLTGFNRLVAPQIRAADARHLIFAEPNSLFNDGIATSVGALNDANAGFAFHIYCLLSGADSSSEEPGGAQVCPTLEEQSFDNAVAHVAQTGEALLMTEFGSTSDTDVVGRITANADAHMTSWLWWSYDSRIGLDVGADPPDAKLVLPVADLLVRAYPRAISGTPTAWSFDPTGHVFTLQYSTQRADGGGAFPAGALSEIFLPPLHYPNGYIATVVGGTVQSAPGASLLEVAAAAGAQSVMVTVAPAQ
jgi:endoglycosylceramidase